MYAFAYCIKYICIMQMKRIFVLFLAGDANELAVTKEKLQVDSSDQPVSSHPPGIPALKAAVDIHQKGVICISYKLSFLFLSVYFLRIILDLCMHVYQIHKCFFWLGCDVIPRSTTHNMILSIWQADRTSQF